MAGSVIAHHSERSQVPPKSGTTKNKPARRAITAAAAVGLTAAGIAVAPGAQAGTETLTYNASCSLGGQTSSGKLSIAAERLRADRDGVTLRLDPGPLPWTPIVGNPAGQGRVTYTLEASGTTTGTHTVTTATVPLPVTPGTPIDLPAQEVDVALPVTLPATVFLYLRSITVTVDGADIPCRTTGGDALASYQLVKTPSHGFSMSSTRVKPGAQVTITGNGWPGGTAPDVCLLTPGGSTCDPARVAGHTLTIDPQGRLAGTITPARTLPAGTYILRVTAGEAEAWAPLTVEAAAPEGILPQAVTASLGAGPLTMTQEGAGISFGSATLNGTAQRLTGALNPVTVLDARGGHLGWTVNATMTDLVTADGAGRIPAGSVNWTPTCAASEESPSAAVPGSPGPLGATAATLCSQTGQAGALTGGRFTAGAELTLTTPDFAAAGSYTGTITLTLS